MLTTRKEFETTLFPAARVAPPSAFSDPALDALVETQAFRRLRHIHFLGAIDYLLVPSPNGALGNIRHTRFQHSLGVANLALMFADSSHFSPKDRREFGAAALLHDIGHAPLSHSLEPVFEQQFGINHHIATVEVMTGRSPLGTQVYQILRHSKINIDRILALISGEDTFPGSEFFSGPINFDTIEGITRSHTYAWPTSPIPTAIAIAEAASRRKDAIDRRIVDSFWHLKNKVYNHVINSTEGFLADKICQKYMLDNISKFSRDDYYTNEDDIFEKLPRLRELLTNPQFPKHAYNIMGPPAVRKIREFYVDTRGDFFGGADTQRYKQRKRLVRFAVRRSWRSELGRPREASKLSAIQRAVQYSNVKLMQLRDVLGEVVPPSATVVTCGSYARREASLSSDLDFFIVTSATELAPEYSDWIERARDNISDVVIVEPAEGGAFNSEENFDDILQNIGGDEDINRKLTKRILLLLEGEWLANENMFKSLRRKILERYIGPGMTDHQLALFLLNDLIRYYRTIAVDYEFKTGESTTPKPWGIRNIKLVFSRKLLFASGLFSVALTADRTRDRKIEILEDLFSMPVLERMEKICGAAALIGVRESYEYFLHKMEDADVRERLKRLMPEQRRDDPLFRDLKNEGHRFTRELLKLFEHTFDATHPIRKAVIF